MDSLNSHRPRTVGVETLWLWAMDQVQIIDLHAHLIITGLPYQFDQLPPRRLAAQGIQDSRALLRA